MQVLLRLAAAVLATVASGSRPAPHKSQSLLGVKARAEKGTKETGASHFPKDADFFTEEAVTMDEDPKWQSRMEGYPWEPVNKSKNCHPKCVWDCGVGACNTHCRPMCKPPHCITKCKKLLTSKCRNICQAPRCAVVCPQHQCESGACPECTTVCGKPICKLECGPEDCQSTCEEPHCTWACSPAGCPQPQCKLTCEQAPCMGFKGSDGQRGGKAITLHDVYAGRVGGTARGTKFLPGTQMAAQGIAAVPPIHTMLLKHPPVFAPPQFPDYALAIGGAKPMDPVSPLQPAPAAAPAPMPFLPVL